MRMRLQPLKDGTTEVDVKLLDDGRACIHWLVECDDGPIRIEGHPALRRWSGAKEAVGHYRLACRPEQNTVNSQKRGNTRFVCMTTNDASAATCPACLATPEVVAALSRKPSDEEKARVAHFAMETVKAVGV